MTCLIALLSGCISAKRQPSTLAFCESSSQQIRLCPPMLLALSS
jgi:hypothetical protein